MVQVYLTIQVALYVLATTAGIVALAKCQYDFWRKTMLYSLLGFVFGAIACLLFIIIRRTRLAKILGQTKHRT
jgi:hypothetical protein